jgi:hypothetical protein
MEDDSVFKFIAAPQGFLHALPVKPAFFFSSMNLTQI